MSNLLKFEEMSTNNPCENCIYNKERHKELSADCSQCGYLSERDKTYVARIPVLLESAINTQQQNATPYSLLREYLHILNENVPVDKNGNIVEMFFDWPIGTPKSEIESYLEQAAYRYIRKDVE